jgi:hypothetical protein
MVLNLMMVWRLWGRGEPSTQGVGGTCPHSDSGFLKKICLLSCSCRGPSVKDCHSNFVLVSPLLWWCVPTGAVIFQHGCLSCQALWSLSYVIAKISRSFPHSGSYQLCNFFTYTVYKFCIACSAAVPHPSFRNLRGCPSSSEVPSDNDCESLVDVPNISSASLKMLHISASIITSCKQAECWGGGERRGERERRSRLGLDTRTKKLFERDKWAIY